MSFLASRKALLTTRRGITSSDSDVTAWIAAVGPSNTTQAEVNLLSTYIVGVKALGIAEDFFFFPAGTQIAQRMCVMRRVNLTEVSSPTWVANKGYTGDGVASYVNLNWKPSDGPNYTQNFAAHGCAVQTIDPRAAGFYVAMGAQSGTPACSLTKPTGSTQWNYGVNNGGATGGTGQAAGRWHADRSASNASGMSLNGVSKLTEAAASGSRPAFSMYGVAHDNAGTAQLFSQHTIGCWYGGGSFGANIAAHDTLLHTLLTGLNSTFYP